MNIKNQIRLSVFISLVLVAAISVSIVLSYQDMQDLRQQESLAADVVRGSYELTYLSNDYLINAEPRARAQWEERYSSVQPVIGQLKPGNSREAKSLEAIRDYNDKIGALFREIPEPGTLRAGETLFPASYQQITWSRMNIQSQGMIYEAWSLRRLYNDDVSEARYRNNILVLVLMMVMLVIIGVNYLVISRRLVRSIREVNAGSEVFATGNLDYRIPVTSDDEIGGIARRLNTMAEQIRNVTASRDELDREKQGHGQAEQALTESERKYRTCTSTHRWGFLRRASKTGRWLPATGSMPNSPASPRLKRRSARIFSTSM
jgi:methyl-accepting chemotaxis protein